MEPKKSTPIPDGSDKDPEGELENPAPFPPSRPATDKPRHHDLEGQQGGQKGGGRE